MESQAQLVQAPWEQSQPLDLPKHTVVLCQGGGSVRAWSWWQARWGAVMMLACLLSFSERRTPSTPSSRPCGGRGGYRHCLALQVVDGCVCG
jgi:hypothetical protein